MAEFVTSPLPYESHTDYLQYKNETFYFIIYSLIYAIFDASQYKKCIRTRSAKNLLLINYY